MLFKLFLSSTCNTINKSIIIRAEQCKLKLTQNDTLNNKGQFIMDMLESLCQ